MEFKSGCDSPQHEVVHKLITVAKRHHHTFDGMRAATGLGRSAHFLLMHISDMETANSQAEIAAVMEISPAAVAVMLKKLEADGYVSREANPTDTRFNTIVLTDKGRKIVKQSHEDFMTLDSAVLDGFSETEIAVLNGYLDRLLKNLETDFEKSAIKQ